jgi:predicted RNA binding protein YcfA (HicA-like mRNA interferase family)
LIKRLRALGFTGPHSGKGKHPEFMVKGTLVVKLPNPHSRDIGEGLLKRILEKADITVDEWLGRE